jgi:hypothetical protein
LSRWGTTLALVATLRRPQASPSTAVTLNKPVGRIMTDTAALAAGTGVTFTVNNSRVAATDLIVFNLRSNFGQYRVEAGNQAAGTFDIRLTNITAGSLTP